MYHFGTRKLSFLKNRTMLAVVQSLVDYPDVRTACRAAGVEDVEQHPYLHALGVLAGSNMLVPAERSDEEEWRRMTRAGDDAEQESDVGAPPACGGEEWRA
jgi:mycofactocin biosynthesis protein MftB